MVVEGIHIEDIFELVSLVLSLITSWTVRILAHEEDCGSTLKQHWLNATCLRKVYKRPGDRLVLGQRRRQLTGIDQQWAATLAQHWTEIWWVGVHLLYQVHRWPAPAMVVEGIHGEDIFKLDSLVLF